MQVEISRGYTGAGDYDLDKMTDESLGQLIKGLLKSINRDPEGGYGGRELRIKEIEEKVEDV